MTKQLNNYQKILTSLKEKIRQARFTAAQTVNVQLLMIYWEVGKTILEQESEEGWGAKTIERLSIDLKTEFSDMKGLSPRNLRYMREFAKAYPDFSILQPMAAKLAGNEILQATPAKLSAAEIMQPLAAQLPWTHHTIILDKVKSREGRLFYMQKTIENGWSKSILSLQIGSDLYKRQGSTINNFENTLTKLQSDLAKETFKNPYVFDFLNMGEEMHERELEKALIQHLKKFLLELGRGFAYVGNQFNLVVDDDDFFLDMLFYNFNLHCFVIFELKIGKFEPEFAGKLNFYVNTINQQIKGLEDKPTIGVLLCKTPNKTVIQYSLKGIDAPIGVADYELSKALPKQLKSEMPTIAELEAEIDKEYEELKTPSQKRFDALKQKVAQMKGDETKQGATTESLFEIIDKSLTPLFKSLLQRLLAYSELFLSHQYHWQGKDSAVTDIEVLGAQWKNEEFLKTNAELYFHFRLNGFKKAGIEAFDVVLQLNFKREMYWYGFNLINYNNQQPFIKKKYHEQLTHSEIDSIVEIVEGFLLDIIEERLKHLNKI